MVVETAPRVQLTSLTLPPAPAFRVRCFNTVDAVEAQFSDTRQRSTVARQGLTAVSTSSMPITDPMDPRLDHLRPADRPRSSSYISREMANGMTDVDFLLTYTNDDVPGRERGPSRQHHAQGRHAVGQDVPGRGAGRRSGPRQMGLPKPMPIFTLSGSSGVTDYDLFGQTTSYTDPRRAWTAWSGSPAWSTWRLRPVASSTWTRSTPWASG